MHRIDRESGMAKHILILLLMVLASVPAFADSLFDANSYQPMVSDHKALKKGDNLTVLITEFASLTTSANTTTKKDGSVFGSLRHTQDTQGTTAELGDDFTGGGTIERSGKLLAQLTVTVQSVDANGELHIKGAQQITVNDEKQDISIEGTVRPQDISPDNTVLSTKVSDAKISYKGKGLLAEKQRPGVLTRFLSWLGIL